jgi:polysaccharide biosynthesis transport protein
MSQYQGDPSSFSMLDILRGMGRRKLLVLSSLLLGAGLGFGIISVIKPKFQSEARIIIDNVATPYDSPNVSQTERTDRQIDDRTVKSQVAVLGSEDLAKRVISQLSLGEKQEFDSMKSGLGMLAQFLIRTGFSDDPRLMTVEERAYEKLSGALTIYPLPESHVIGIKYTSSNGETAAAVANAIAETYVLSTRETKADDTGRARQWLSTQIESLRQRVAESDAAVEAYRAEAGLLKGQSATLGTQQLSELNTQITAAEAAQSEAQAKADEIRDLLETQGSVEASSEVMASSTIQRLQEQQANAERRLTDLSVTYLDNHPKMIAARKEVTSVGNRIRREALKIVDGLQGQAKIAAARAASLRKSLEALKDREGGALQEEVKLKQLERDAKANRDQLELMLARYADTNTRQNLDLQPGFARIIQTATVPKSPYFPRVGPIILLTSLAGMGFGLGLAFLLEIMSQASRMSAGQQQQPRGRHPARAVSERQIEIPPLTMQDVSAAHELPMEKPFQPAPSMEKVTTLPVTLASIPQARSTMEARTLLASFANGGARQNSFDQLSLHFQAMRGKGQLKALAVAGIGGQSETATVALALARGFADNGQKTILIDLSPDNNTLTDLLELSAAPGLSELVSGAADFNRAIQRDSKSKLQFMRFGAGGAQAAPQVAGHMEAIIRTLSGIYEVVLLHIGEATPALLQQAKGCTTVLLHTPVARKKDAAAAAGTLKSKGFEHVYLVQVDGVQQAAA